MINTASGKTYVIEGGYLDIGIEEDPETEDFEAEEDPKTEEE